MTRKKALEAEQREIARVTSEGFMLANYQHNPARPSTPQEVVRAVLRKKGSK